MKKLLMGDERDPIHPADEADVRTAERAAMVERQIVRRGIRDERVLAAMRRVPRHLFVPEAHRGEAYEDHPLPIGLGQTISQPYIVAYMTEALQLKPGARVLEVGTGSAYQAAVLAELAALVYSVEILPALAETARGLLAKLGYKNVEVASCDGGDGWPGQAPYDGILVAAAAERVPMALLGQMKEDGRLIMPVGLTRVQQLLLVRRTGNDWIKESVMPVCFVLMTGRVQMRDFA